MKFQKINRGVGKKRVLIAPLDWGLGHATRCIPIIYELLALNVEVIIAAGEKTGNLLEKEFPKLEIMYLKGYDVKYSNKRWWLPAALCFQIPKIISRIFHEHCWIKKAIHEYRIDAVISDNRLGLYQKKTPCIYITHQLTIKTGNPFSEWLAKKIHSFFINKYTACWVPDNEFNPALAGELSHPKKKPRIPTVYLGPLSRFKKYNEEKKYDCIALVSGPEPQRSVFEKILIRELKIFPGKSLLLRGLPGNQEEYLNEDNRIEIKNHLTATELNSAILQSDLIICRSGYTSVMDLVQLQKKAVLIATPGQTEQEYLAQYLQQQLVFPAISQQVFSLQNAVAASHNFLYSNLDMNTEQYKLVVHQFAALLMQDQ
jgi:uncharacterized protein (TIGR00661 family)